MPHSKAWGILRRHDESIPNAKNSLVPIQKDKVGFFSVVSSHLDFSNGTYECLSLVQKPEYIICKTRK